MGRPLSMHVKFDATELGFFTVVLLALVVDMGDRDKSKMENRFSRDLLNRFMGSGEMEGRFDAEGEEEEAVELNLGLSLGGRFGVDKSSMNNLTRSSSVAAYLPVVRDDEAVAAAAAAAAAAQPPVAYSALTRTASLPVETEEEWRKRKELQTLRRMEAKRRRSEKQRILKAEREGGGGGGSGGGRWGEEEKREVEVSVRRRSDKDNFLAASKRFGPPLGMPVFGRFVQGQSSFLSEPEAAAAKGRQPGSQGSVVESHGGSSSSEMESRPIQGSSSCGELSPVSIKSLREASNEDVGSSGSKLIRESNSAKFIRESSSAGLKLRECSGKTSTMETGNTSRPAQTTDIAKNQKKETGKNTLEEMPCVFTKGDGPNGRRVEGILYKYGRGEEVRIMCVCHGTFLSPAEFVRHAGGTDVTQPLKHIVVNPNASPFQ